VLLDIVMQPKNILFLIRSLDKGGAEKQLSLLAVGLAGMGHQVRVLTYYNEANISGNFNYDLLHKAGVEVISINKRGRYDIIGFLFRYIKILKQTKPDIIYSFLELSNFLACFARVILKNVKIVWGKRSSALEFGNYNFALKVEHKLEKLLSFVPNLIIANSNKGRDYIQSLGYKAKIVVVYNGILEQNIQMPDMRYSLFSKYNIQSQDKLVGAVGRIDSAKDYETLIKAFYLAFMQNKNLKLLIVGREIDHVYAHRVYSLIESYNIGDKVFFIPEMEHIVYFYASIDLFVSSSYTEGFSNVIGEAMAHGLLCVVTDAGDSKILVGDTGIVVPIRDCKALANGILESITKDKQQIGQRAMQRVHDLYTVEKMVNNTNRYLDEIYEN
jgi:glycosyltransferase involved in cell wall biosynthesis